MADPVTVSRLAALDMAGACVPHERAQNLGAIGKLLKGEPFYTFGIKAVEAAVRSGRLTVGTVLADVARLTGCSPDPRLQSGPGYIDPGRTTAGLRLLADRLAAACADGQRVAFGTGHPGSLLGFWTPLAHWAAAHGAQLVTGPVGHPVGPGQCLDVIGHVGTVSDGCSLLHHHSHRAGEATLAGQRVDLVCGDHGWAGAAINAGLPCVAVMDTNDPGLAVAAGLGVLGLTVIPSGDNSPNGVMGEVAEWVMRRAAGQPGPLD
ncbi:MAG: phosphatase [Candidatus Sericytochromatia bacterium]|nr:phosphatase [Candidatus Sericytochromatia bacterium]